MPRVLLVEHDESQGILFHDELIEKGYEVLLLNDGKEAWKYLEESACDLVVMDVPSWGEEGADAWGKGKKRDGELPWIAHIAFAADERNPAARMADASVVKSSDSSVLQATIKDLLAKRSMRMKEKNKKGTTQR